MGFWGWFFVWLALIVAALGVFAYIGWQLAGKAMRAGAQAMALAERISALAAGLQAESDYVSPESAVLAEPAVVFAKRADIVRNKADKAEARQRRLIKALAAINVDERRFTDG